MSAEADAQKLELLRQAIPRGLSAGDTGLVESRGTPYQMNGFPQFRSAITQTKQYNNNPAISADAPLAQSTRADRRSHPWKISIRVVPSSNPPQYQYKVELNSNVYTRIDSFEDKIEVVGLDFWDTADEGFLYLFGVVEDGVCTEASIEGPVEIPSDRIDMIGSQQESFSMIIGYIYKDENDVLQVIQNAFQDVTLMDVCIFGNPAIYPMAV